MARKTTSAVIALCKAVFQAKSKHHFIEAAWLSHCRAFMHPMGTVWLFRIRSPKHRCNPLDTGGLCRLCAYYYLL